LTRHYLIILILLSLIAIVFLIAKTYFMLQKTSIQELSQK
jgi:hypothetical protein